MELGKNRVIQDGKSFKSNNEWYIQRIINRGDGIDMIGTIKTLRSKKYGKNE